MHLCAPFPLMPFSDPQVGPWWVVYYVTIVHIYYAQPRGLSLKSTHSDAKNTSVPPPNFTWTFYVSPALNPFSFH